MFATMELHAGITFQRKISSPDNCTNCSKPERSHVWRCVKCNAAAQPGTCGCGICFVPGNIPCSCKANLMLFCTEPVLS